MTNLDVSHDLPEGAVPTRTVRLRGEVARRYADLVSVVTDLRLAIRCCEQLAAALEKYDPQNPQSDEGVRVESLWTTALVVYVRAFAGGVRRGLNNDIFEQIGRNTREAHEWAVNMRDKRIAHAVNPFEQVQAIGLLSADSRLVHGVGHFAIRHIAPGDGAEALATLAGLVHDAVIPMVEEAETALRDELAALDEEELRRLPTQTLAVPGPEEAGSARD